MIPGETHTQHDAGAGTFDATRQALRQAAPQALPGGRATLDDLFRRAGVRRPDTIALIDPPDRAVALSGPPRRMTYAEADRAVTAIAGWLRRLGLAPESVVGIQLPHTIESVLTLLGVLRAGMIAAPLPMLWRQSELADALSRLGARVLIAGGATTGIAFGTLAAEVAAKVFPIRYVCGFGDALPDGVIPLDDLLSETARETPMLPPGRNGNPAQHVAVVTWDVTPAGLVPVARSHAELIAGGLAMLLEARLQEDATILTTCPSASFAGLALGVLPWLLTGGTLALHQPFDAALFASQCDETQCDAVAVPGPLVARLGEAGHFDRGRVRHVLGLWRAPERIANAARWTHPHATLTDVLAFGEVGLLAAQRGEDGLPIPLPHGPVTAPRGAPGALLVAETARTTDGSLSLRGPMAPAAAWPPGAERSGEPCLAPNAAGFVDTGYACRIAADTLVVTGPPPGIVSVGGYRFLLHDLQSVANRAEFGAGLAALPDALGGHRLAGHAEDRTRVRDLLASAGLNPLIADAFRGRNGSDAASRPHTNA